MDTATPDHGKHVRTCDIDSHLFPVSPTEAVDQGAVEVDRGRGAGAGEDVEDVDSGMACQVGFELVIVAYNPTEPILDIVGKTARYQGRLTPDWPQPPASPDNSGRPSPQRLSSNPPASTPSPAL